MLCFSHDGMGGMGGGYGGMGGGMGGMGGGMGGNTEVGWQDTWCSMLLL